MASNPFVHVELATTDLPKAKEFYGNLFDWELSDSSVEGYTTIGVGENEYGVGGGMMKAPMPNLPSHWMAYVAVSDIEGMTAKAQSLGGTVLKEVTSIDSVGWFSIIQDPTGAVLALFKANQP